jgi:hypothetical protein
MIDVEAYIVFLAAVFFSFLYFASRDSINNHGSSVAFGMMATSCWTVLGLLWLFLVNQPSSSGGTVYGTYAVALLFFGFSVLHIVFILSDEVSFANKLKHKEVED